MCTVLGRSPYRSSMRVTATLGALCLLAKACRTGREAAYFSYRSHGDWWGRL